MKIAIEIEQPYCVHPVENYLVGVHGRSLVCKCPVCGRSETVGVSARAQVRVVDPEKARAS
jgi:hypothetical protein